MLSKDMRDRLDAIRAAMDSAGATIASDPDAAIAAKDIYRVWSPGVYVVGDVRKHGDNLFMCCQAHDSTANEDWSPDAVPALWFSYHGTTQATALPWVKPSGAHDMYNAGEYMIYTDGIVYLCLSDTAYSPDEYAGAWEAVH